MLCLTNLERDCNLSKKFNKYLKTKIQIKNMLKKIMHDTQTRESYLVAIIKHLWLF